MVGFLRNVGSPVISYGDSVWGKPIPKLQAHLIRALAGWERSTRHTVGIANRRQRSAAKRVAGWLSVLVVPMKRGNSNPRGPRGGKEKPSRGRLVMDSLEGNVSNAQEFE